MTRSGPPQEEGRRVGEAILQRYLCQLPWQFHAARHTVPPVGSCSVELFSSCCGRIPPPSSKPPPPPPYPSRPLYFSLIITPIDTVQPPQERPCHTWKTKRRRSCRIVPLLPLRSAAPESKLYTQDATTTTTNDERRRRRRRRPDDDDERRGVK